MDRSPEREAQITMKTSLSSKNLLAELEQPRNREILAQFTPVRHGKAALIHAPGNATDQVFIVTQGRVRIYLAFEDKDFSLAILEPGDIYSSHTRAYVEAMEEVELLVIPTERFHACISSSPIFSRTIISTLGELMKRSFSIIESLVFKDVTQRVVDFFMHETVAHGIRDAAGHRVEIDLTMEQLASVVGASRQTVSTIVNDLLRSGSLVKEGRRTYLVPNLEILKDFPHA